MFSLQRGTMRGQHLSFLKAVLSCYLCILLSTLHTVNAGDNPKLLNAYRSAPNSVDTAMLPQRSYFFEFPLEDASFAAPRLAPLCSNRSPFSFMFQRGTDAHFRKILVEFEGGPACFEADCGCDGHSRQTPWKHYLDQYHHNETSADQKSTMASPNLGTCSGIVPKFIENLSPRLFGNATDDIPLSIRRQAQNSSSSNTNATTDSTWWQALSSDIDEWSYLLIPHCSMDWYLGYQAQGRFSGCQLDGPDPPFDGPWWDAPVYQGRERIWHRGNANLDAVLDWLQTQFGNEDTTSLEAMITVSGGKIGGCSDDPDYTSTIAPMIFAAEAAEAFEWNDPSSILAILEGSAFFHPNLPSNQILDEPWNPKVLSGGSNLVSDVGQMIVEASDVIDVAWMSSSSPSDTESQALANLQEAKPDHFYLYTPPAISTTMDSSASVCPRFAFSNAASDNKETAAFFTELAKDKSWKSSLKFVTSSEEDNATLQTKNSKSLTVKRMGYLSIVMLFLGILAVAWTVYFCLKRRRQKLGLSPPLSPNELWMKALIYYPAWFLLVSVTLPLTLSLVGFARSGYKVDVNLDFESYLDISSELDIVANNYAAARQFQADSFTEASSQCRAMGGGDGNRRRRQLWDDIETEESQAWDTRHRRLQGNVETISSERIAYVTIYIIYQSRNGGNVFSPEVLSSIYDFEEYVRSLPDFETYCRRDKEDCSPFDTPLTYLYQNGTVVEDIEEALSSKARGSHVDQYFGAENLQSNITKSVIYFQGPQSEMDLFLEDLYNNFLWKRDQEKYYEDMVFTWENGYLLRLEANDALYHDSLWSVGSLVVIGLMILLKVQDLFIFFFGMTGLLLAFTTSFYWCSTHFGIPDVTLLHVSGLFVMLGIGADDIFLMTDSYIHAEADVSSGPDTSAEQEHAVIRSKMLWAYETAGSMMLVSSMTAAVCFFSNGFGVLLVIQEFGIYMGVVVMINYFHVMTILPSAILVNEMYLKPWKRKILPGWCLNEGHDGTGTRETNGQRIKLDETVLTARASGMPSAPDRIVAANSGVEITLGVSPQQDDIAEDSIPLNASRLNRIDRMLLNRESRGSASSGGSGDGDGGSGCTGVDCGGGDGSGGGSGGGGNGGGDGSGGGSGGGGNGGGGGGSGGGNGGGGGNSGNSTFAPIEIAPTAPTPPTIAPTLSPSLQPSPAVSANATDTMGSSSTIIEVKLIFGVGVSDGQSTGPWTVEVVSEEATAQQRDDVLSLDGLISAFDVSSPESQQWLLDVAKAARLDKSLDVIEDAVTWIELFAEFVSNEIEGFPVPKELFTSYVEVLESTNPQFSRLVEGEIGTDLPGLAGSSLYASITFRSYDSATLTTFEKWDQFARAMNSAAPDPSVQMVAQSDLFWNEARANETVDATVMTWLIANLFCFAIILVFTQNILLCLMVMATILLMFFCIAGWLFAILQLPLGPVQALGVSIFIGLSANYSLHVVHAYHRSKSNNRETKVKEAVFITGSPIFASALSTIGGCVFLFGCRTLALVELGILICCVVAMALVYSMGFLLAWLLAIGPLPVGAEIDGYQKHRWDICAIGKKHISNNAERSAPEKSNDRGNANDGSTGDTKATPSNRVLDKDGLSGSIEADSLLFDL
ncbi:MAG: hypothetical protein SGBAC_007368 [Bacillariaceae sp.]